MAIQHGVEEHEEEVLVVEIADAIVDPGTVVVHSANTSLAYSAVMCAIRLVFATPFAMSSVAAFFGFLQEGWQIGTHS